MIKIGLDANGGDFGVNSTVPGAMMAVEKYKDIEIVLYGDEAKIKPLLTNSERITIVDAKDTISMGEEDPFRAVRKGKETSLVKAMTGAKTKEVDAVVTSGPTQAVVMAAHIIVKRLPKIERVALCPLLPNRDGNPRLMLDVGANVELKPEHIGQFAIFATVAAKEILGIDNPKVGYLNIGSEPGKGRDIDNEAYYYLKDLKGINFYGNIEPDEVMIESGVFNCIIHEKKNFSHGRFINYENLNNTCSIYFKEKTTNLTLNNEQQEAFEKIKESGEYLLYGVTGSGKTEIYLQLIQKQLQQGKSSIMLIPEISLTPQTVDRFIA